MRVTSGVATTTAEAAGGTGAAAERHPLRLVLAIARYKSHELGGCHLRPGVTCDGMSDELRVDDWVECGESTTSAHPAKKTLFVTTIGACRKAPLGTSAELPS
jgi:hypothetical protein